jgi:hypothetical protein
VQSGALGKFLLGIAPLVAELPQPKEPLHRCLIP